MSLNPYALSVFLIALIAAATAAGAWRRRPVPGAVCLAIMQAGTAISLSAYAMELTSTAQDAKLAWALLAYAGCALSAPASLLLVLWYTGRAEWLRRRRAAALFIPACLAVGIALTTPWHRLHYSAAWIDASGPIPMLRKAYGPLYLPVLLCLYSYFVAASLLALQMLWRSSRMHRGQTGVVLLGVLLPLIAHAAYVSGYRLLGFLNPVYLSYALTGLLVAWGLTRFQLAQLRPVARETLFENLRDGVLLLDSQGRVVDLNRSARALLGVCGDPTGRPLQQVPGLAPEIRAGCLAAGDAPIELQAGGTPPRWLQVQASVLPDGAGQPIGRQVVLTDITAHKQAKLDLQSLNASLEQRVQERTAELRHMQQELAIALVDRTRQLSALFDMVLVGGQSLGLPDLLDRSLDKVMTTLGGCAICLHEWNAAAAELCLLAERGFDAAARRSAERWPGDQLDSMDAPRAVFDLDEAIAPGYAQLPGCHAYLGALILVNGRRSGLLSLWWTQAHAIQIEDIALFSTMADQIGIILENARLRQRIERNAAQQERRRLARDLHDSVAQSLHSLVLFADTIQCRMALGQTSQWQPLMGDLAESARQALKEMRLLLYEMRLPDQDSLPLVEALRLRLGSVEQRAGLCASLEVDDGAAWPAECEGDLYAVATEALNNALKHARASRVAVRLGELPEGVELSVEDDGCGFDPQHPTAGGHGLHSMAERAGHVNGSLIIRSASGRGTRVALRIPRPEVQRADPPAPAMAFSERGQAVAVLRGSEVSV
jgi:signal transduction histidine kinase/PAS domain-containing protein